jgi:NAD(P)H-flavin reductase
MLYRYGLGEAAISISGDPAHPERLVHTIRAVGHLTRDLCSLQEGDVVGVRGPFGTHWPVERADGMDVVVVAGGIGLAPLRPAILHLLAHRARYGRVVVLYGARSAEDLLFLEELRRWRSRFDTEVEVTVDQAGPGWRGPVGVVTRLVERAVFDPDDAMVLTCGPEIMMRFCVAELLREGVPEERIFASMERNMRCAVALCGHCQWGPHLLCRDGPVLPWDRVAPLVGVREL